MMIRSAILAPRAVASNLRKGKAGSRFMSREVFVDLTVPNAAKAPVPKEVPAAAPAAPVEKIVTKSKPSASFWQKFVAFSTGLGVASVFYFFTLQQDLEVSKAYIGGGLSNLKTDLEKNNLAINTKIAVLEHEISILKKELRSRKYE